MKIVKLMILKTIEIRNFRNHTYSKMEFSDNLNLFVGGNAQGKTSILEAISYLCLTKSFNANSDSYVLNFSSNFFEVSGKFRFDDGHEANVRVFFESGRGKRVFLNKENIEKFSTIVNKFPSVILTPRTKEIIYGSPEDRRKFFDLALAQLSSVYADELIDYKKILTQRNKVLSAIFSGEVRFEQGIELLDVWSQSFIDYSARLIFRKARFINDFVEFFRNVYSNLGINEVADIEYITQVNVSVEDSFETVREKFRTALNKIRAEELRRGITLIGPHRDEYVFKINGLDAKKFASQGQIKAILIALTVAKFFYLKERKRETPILLLDDVFAELDSQRSKKMLSLVGNVGQVFITTTDLSVVAGVVENFEVKKFIVNSGQVFDA